MEYLVIKWLHILSATLLFGTGLGSAFYKWRADRSGNTHAIYITNRNVVLADWLFTTPTVLIQPITGFWLLHLLGLSVLEPWVMLSLILFISAGLCWLFVVYLQIKMRDIAYKTIPTKKALPLHYQQLAKIWFWLGIPAFTAIIMVYALMVIKPTFASTFISTFTTTVAPMLVVTN